MRDILFKSFLFVVFFNTMVFAQVEEMPVSVRVNHTKSLSQFLDDLQDEFALIILYNPEEISEIRVEQLNVKDRSLKDLFDLLAKNYGIKYSFQNDLINVFGPNETVKESLINSGSINLNEVVATGYSNQRRNTLATSVSKLDTKVLENAPRGNAATALQGAIAGLKVTQNTGQPGSTPSITLRGGTDFNGGGSPLILIDNVPGSFYALNADDIESIEVLKDAAASAIYGARAANGVILVTTKKGKAGKSSISVKSRYTINKRAESKMKYMNAADFIKFNRMAISAYRDQIDPNGFTSYIEGQYPAGTGNNPYDSRFTTMVLTDKNKYLLNFDGWQTIQDPLNPSQKLIFQENKMSELFYQPSYGQDYNISFSGGNERGTYYLSLGHLDEKGLVFGSKFKRISANFNGSYKLSDKFKVSSSILYGHSNNTPNYLGNDYFVFQRAAGQPPTARIYNNNPDGSLSSDLQPGISYDFGNPLYYGDKFIRKNLEQRLTANLQFDYQFLPHFNLMLRGGHFTVNNRNERFNKAYLNGGRFIDARNASASHGQNFRNQITSVLSYQNKFGKHNLNLLLGLEYFRDNSWEMKAATKNSPIDLIYTMNVASEADGVPSTSTTEYAINSKFGQLNYDFDNRYLLGLTFRHDGTSRLAPGNKYEFFPGISLGWNLQNETFFKESLLNNVINTIKPRLSYGVNGNIEVLGNFSVFGAYTNSGIYNSKSGFLNTSLPNYGLKWEKSATLNFGLDLGLMNNRISLIADYFIRDVQDKLSDLNLPVWTGFNSIKVNNGILQNRGLEIELSADLIRNKDFKWNLSGTYYQVRNYAKKLPENGLDRNRQGGVQIYNPLTGKVEYVAGLQEGKRVGLDVVTAYVFDGVYKTQADIDAHAGRVVKFARNPNTRFLGDTKYLDLNGDNIIDYRDRKILGRTTPTFSGGLSSNLNYKNLNLFVKTDFAMGHLVTNLNRVRGITQVQGAQNGPQEIVNSWTPSNSDSNIPRFVFTDPQGNHKGGNGENYYDSNSIYWEKGDYLAIREITLSYDLDVSKINNAIGGLRLFLTGSNLHYFTKYSGNSPENGGLDYGRFPLPRAYTVGLSLTF